jgi:primosomal protein N' (replication factor Y)
MGDKLLSVETLAKISEGKTQEYARISKRNTYKLQTLLVDMRPKIEKEDSRQETEKASWQAISPDLQEMIRYAKKANKKLFIYSARRGISAQTVCRDCGTTVLCESCEAPVVLHTKHKDGGEEKRFVCHHCGKSRSALEQCKNCQSWNLISYGVGIEKIVEEIKALGVTDVIRIDSDSVKTPKEAQDKIDNFLSNLASVLVGTDLCLRLLPDESVDFSAIPSIDSIASLPDFRTNERVMHTILDVKAKAKECMLIQSRNPESKVIEEGLAGDLESFARDEMKARKQFGYPPYMKIVKLTVAGKKENVKADAQIVANRLAKYNPTIFPAFIKAIRGETLLHIMIKVPSRDWPDKELSEILLSLPPSVRIDTSPQSLL